MSPTPFVLSREGGRSTIHLQREKKKPETIVIDCPDYLYALEADAVGDAIAAGLKESPCMPVADSLGNMRAPGCVARLGRVWCTTRRNRSRRRALTVWRVYGLGSLV